MLSHPESPDTVTNVRNNGIKRGLPRKVELPNTEVHELRDRIYSNLDWDVIISEWNEFDTVGVQQTDTAMKKNLPVFRSKQKNSLARDVICPQPTTYTQKCGRILRESDICDFEIFRYKYNNTKFQFMGTILNNANPTE